MNRKLIVNVCFSSLVAVVAASGCFPDFDGLMSEPHASGGTSAGAGAGRGGSFNTTAGSEATSGGEGGAPSGSGSGGTGGSINGGSVNGGVGGSSGADAGGAGGEGTPCDPPLAVVGAPPVVHYDFEEGTGTSVGDSSDAGNDGTLDGAAWQATGRVGGGVDLAGEGQRVTVPAGVLEDVEAMTVMMWVKLIAAPVASTLFDFGTGADERFALQVNDGAATPTMKLIAKTAELDESIAAQLTLPTNRWNHVAVTLGDGQATVYVDGRPLARGAMTLKPADLGALADGWLGQPHGTGVNTYGTVDDFRVYDRLVDPKEISQIALEGADYSYFTFDEACPNEVFAVAPADMSAKLPNGATVAAGRLGKALEFNVPNKTQQHAVLPNGIVQNCTEDLTLAAWVNLKTGNTWARVFDLGTGTSTFMYLTPTTAHGTIRFAAKLNAGEGDSSAEQTLLRTNVLDLGVWRHLAVVLDATNSGHLYVDGVEVSTSTTITINPSDMGETLQNYLGKSQYAVDEYLSGRLDEIVISCRAFTFDEIQLLAKLAPAQ